MRRLLIVPIIHSQTDLGSLTDSVNATKDAALGSEQACRVRQTIAEFWESLRFSLQSMELPLQQMLVYQDGLPVVANATLQIEKQIVSELARKGSPNHQLVQWMVDGGASLVGTESPELLMKEYAAIRKSLESGFANSRASDPSTPSEAHSSEASSAESTERSLIEQRDEFIASRINTTLGNDQLGVLFIGMAHRVEDYLADDIEFSFPVGRPRERVAANYR